MGCRCRYNKDYDRVNSQKLLTSRNYYELFIHIAFKVQTSESILKETTLNVIRSYRVETYLIFMERYISVLTK